MTKEEILAMQSGAELDKLVAEKVMGWKKNVRFVNDLGTEVQMVDWKDEKGYDITRKAAFFYPSTDISAAWEVVGRIDNGTRDVGITKSPYYDDVWIVEVSPFDEDEEGIINIIDRNIAESKSAPEAICKASLLAVMEL